MKKEALWNICQPGMGAQTHQEKCQLQACILGLASLDIGHLQCIKMSLSTLGNGNATCGKNTFGNVSTKNVQIFPMLSFIQTDLSIFFVNCICSCKCKCRAFKKMILLAMMHIQNPSINNVTIVEHQSTYSRPQVVLALQLAETA